VVSSIAAISELLGFSFYLIEYLARRSFNIAETDLIQTSVYDKYPGSMKITTQLDHIRHCKNSTWYKSVEKMDLPSMYHKHSPRFHVQTLLLNQLEFNQNYYPFFILLTYIVLYGKFP